VYQNLNWPTNGSTLEPMVRQLAYRSSLDAEDRAAVLALPFIFKTVEPRHFVVRERELTTHACVLLSGFAIRSKLVATGHRTIAAISIRGEVVDLQNSLLKVADHGVEMLTAGRVAMIPRDEITRIAFERPAVGRAMWRDTLVDSSIFREWLANVGRRDARTRIAHLLCEFSLRLEVAGLGKQSDYELPMTQEQLGDATGLTSVHVNRTIKGLERDGLIDRVHPRSIQIGNWRNLAEAGDFDSNYLHLRADEPALN
jgi:CRP-like cAMP-binding protein